MKQNFYQSYFEAVKQILAGNPIRDLEEIRQECTDAFLKGLSKKELEHQMGFNPAALIVSFIADAENKILMGTDSIEAYSGFQGLEPAYFRSEGRKAVEWFVEQSLYCSQ